jgi:hypothetical protein
LARDERGIGLAAVVAINLSEVGPVDTVYVQRIERRLQEHDAPEGAHVDAGVERLGRQPRRTLGEQVDSGTVTKSCQ